MATPQKTWGLTSFDASHPFTIGKPRMKPDTTGPARFQFTIARLWACVTLVAFAAWVATQGDFISIKAEEAGDVNLFPILAAGLLLAAAIGVLFHGKRGAGEGARAGGAMAIAILLLLSLFAALRTILAWL